MSITNLNKFQKFFYDYGRFHYNKVNVWIHIICVPFITYTLGRIIGHLANTHFDIKLNPIYLLFTVLTCLYVYVDFVSGLLTIVQNVSLLYYFSDFDFSCGSWSNIQVITAIHLVSWILQFLGHGIFEKRKPALMDNLLLTFNAPVFVNIELMYMFFGYRRKDIEEAFVYIKKDVEEYRKSFKNNKKGE